jgi:hypothetical protein
MRTDLRLALAGLALVAFPALAQQAPPEAAIAPLGNAVRGFDAPQPMLILAPPDHVFVAGLAPGENLAIPAKSATTIDAACPVNAASYGVCKSVVRKLGPDKGFLGGPAYASTAAGAGGMAAGIMALEGVAALLKSN